MSNEQGRIFFEDATLTEEWILDSPNRRIVYTIPFRLSVENQIDWTAATHSQRSLIEVNLRQKMKPIIQAWLVNLHPQANDFSCNPDFKKSVIHAAATVPPLVGQTNPLNPPVSFVATPLINDSDMNNYVFTVVNKDDKDSWGEWGDIDQVLSDWEAEDTGEKSFWDDGAIVWKKKGYK